MDTTENKTEHFLKKNYPEFKPEKAGVPYTTDLGELAYYVGLGAEGSFESKNGLLPTWFMEPISPPMEVKDADKERLIKCVVAKLVSDDVIAEPKEGRKATLIYYIAVGIVDEILKLK